MNHTKTSGTLNIARLIEEAEALLLGETTKSCNNGCGKCNTHACSDKKSSHPSHRAPILAAK